MSEQQRYILTLTEDECESVFRVLYEAYAYNLMHERHIPLIAGVLDCLRERE